MAPLPTIGNCVRVAMTWNTFGGVRPVNVLHLITNSTDETEIATALDDAFFSTGSACFTAISSQYSVDFYTVTLLDGSSASQVVDATNGVGGLTGSAPSPATAAVLSLRSPQRGSRGRGRLYLGPIAEGAVDNGIIDSTMRTTMLGAWEDVQVDLASSPAAASLGVASYTHSEVNGVTSVSMRPQAGTQRRRQDQLV